MKIIDYTDENRFRVLVLDNDDPISLFLLEADMDKNGTLVAKFINAEMTSGNDVLSSLKLTPDSVTKITTHRDENNYEILTCTIKPNHWAIKQYNERGTFLGIYNMHNFL